MKMAVIILTLILIAGLIFCDWQEKRFGNHQIDILARDYYGLERNYNEKVYDFRRRITSQITKVMPRTESGLKMKILDNFKFLKEHDVTVNIGEQCEVFIYVTPKAPLWYRNNIHDYARSILPAFIQIFVIPDWQEES